MTETSMFWDGTTTGDASVSPYDAATEFAKVLRSLASAAAIATNLSGVFRGELNGLEASGTASPVAVADGRALAYGTWYESDATTNVVIPTPSAGNSRIDRIVLRKDWSAQTVRITRIAGTQGGAPSAPAMTQVAGTTWDMPLATALINDAGTILVLDERQFLPLTANTAESSLAADVPMSVINTYYDGPSVVLGPGTWLLTGTVTVEYGTVNNNVTAKLWNGTTVEASTEAAVHTVAQLQLSLSLSGIVTIASGTETWKISVANQRTDGNILAAAPTNGAGNNASFLRAIRIF